MSSILPRKLAIVGPNSAGGGSALIPKLKAFLEQAEIRVDIFDQSRSSGWLRQRHRLLWRFDGLDIQTRYNRELAKHLRAQKYPVVITIDGGSLLLEKFNKDTQRILYATAPQAHESYYRNLVRGKLNADAQFAQELEAERAIYAAADKVIVAWNTYEDFIRKNVFDGDKIISHPGLGWYGCEPQPERATYQHPPSIVYLGNIVWFSNPSLLAQLTMTSSYTIDSYGPLNERDKASAKGINYKGFAPQLWSTLRRYQFGLNTVSQDPVRIAAFSSKILAYLSVGLPTFSPMWQRFSHQVDGVVPYSSEDFHEVVATLSDPTVWTSSSDAAYEQAKSLAWDRVLSPLLALL